MTQHTPHARTSLVAWGGLLLTSALPAFSQEEPPPIQRLDKIEVTGSNIPRLEGETALPVQIIKREEIQRSGATTAAEVLNLVSANVNGFNDALAIGDIRGAPASANLRGLGDGSTLVLLNGRRLANYAFGDTAVDLNSIPLAAIDRVEILKDGASAIYGTDAIAGVVNFILRKDYRGAEVSAYFAEPEHGGARKKQAILSAGFGDLSTDRFNILATLDYQKEGALHARDRAFSSTYFIPAEKVNMLSSNTFPANIRASENLLINPTFASGCTPPTSLPTRFGLFPAAPACGFDIATVFDIIPPSERTNLVGRATFQLSPDHQVFAEVVYAYNRFLLNISPTPASEFVTISLAPILYPAGGPFYPTALAAANGLTGDLDLFYRTFPLGPRQDLVKSTAQRMVVGAEGVVSGWNYNAALNHSENREQDIFGGGWVSEKKLIAALATGLINPFGPSGPQGEALLASTQLAGEARGAKGTTDSLDARVSKEIYHLAAGPLALALGAEARREKLDDAQGPVTSSGDLLGGGVPIQSVSGSRSVQAAFAELNIPLGQSLEAQLAARSDHYSDFGSTTNPKIALRWQPAKSWLFRTSYGTGFRAPTLPDLLTPLSQSFTGARMDPLRCPTTGLPRDCAFNFPALTGGNPDLKPEESEQFTVGMVWEPAAGFSVGLDFWKINKTHVIGTLEEDTLFQNFDKFGGSNVVRGPVDPAFPNLPGPIQLVFENNQNFGNLRTSGVDLDLSYRSPQMAAGRFGFNLSGTYVHDWREQLDGVNYVSLLGSHINGVAIQRWRHYLTVNWDYGLWAATLAETFILGYTDAQLNAAGNERRVGNYEVWDVQGTYSGIRSLKIALGIKNLFDRAPPFSNQVDTFQIGYDPHYADPRGRTYYGRVTYSFK